MVTKGMFLIGANGSVGVVLKPCKNVAGHVEVEIIIPKGYHRKGDVVIWPDDCPRA